VTQHSRNPEEDTMAHAIGTDAQLPTHSRVRRVHARDIRKGDWVRIGSRALPVVEDARHNEAGRVEIHAVGAVLEVGPRDWYRVNQQLRPVGDDRFTELAQAMRETR
jgi:hypothetical protein